MKLEPVSDFEIAAINARAHNGHIMLAERLEMAIAAGKLHVTRGICSASVSPAHLGYLHDVGALRYSKGSSWETWWITSRTQEWIRIVLEKEASAS